MSENKPKTLDQARQRIAFLESQLSGSGKPLATASNPAKVVPPKVRALANKGRTSKEIIANSISLSLADKLSTLKATLESETNSDKRLAAIADSEAELRSMLKAERDPVKQVSITRGIAKLNKAYALELYQNKPAWDKRNQVIEHDL